MIAEEWPDLQTAKTNVRIYPGHRQEAAYEASEDRNGIKT